MRISITSPLTQVTSVVLAVALSAVSVPMLAGTAHAEPGVVKASVGSVAEAGQGMRPHTRRAKKPDGIKVSKVRVTKKGRLFQASIKWDSTTVKKSGTNKKYVVRLVGHRGASPVEVTRDLSGPVAHLKVAVSRKKAKGFAQSSEVLLSVSQRYDSPTDHDSLYETFHTSVSHLRHVGKRAAGTYRALRPRTVSEVDGRLYHSAGVIDLSGVHLGRIKWRGSGKRTRSASGGGQVVSYDANYTDSSFVGAVWSAGSYTLTDFAGSNLTNSVFQSGADFTGSNFSFDPNINVYAIANLSNATFNAGVNLTSANFNYQDFTRFTVGTGSASAATNFTNATVAYANFSTGNQPGAPSSVSTAGSGSQSCNSQNYISLGNANFSGVDFSNILSGSMGGAYLGSAVLSGANLSGISFVVPGDCAPTWLVGVNLSRTNLTGASFTASDTQSGNPAIPSLAGANLSNATIQGFSITGFDLSQANLSGLDLSSSALPSLAGTNLAYANLTNANLSGQDLTGNAATSTGLVLQGANLTGVNFNGATMTGGNFSFATFGTSAQNPSTLPANLQNTNFSNANLAGMSLVGPGGQPAYNLSNSTFMNANLTGTQLSLATGPNSVQQTIQNSAAALTNTNFAGANLTNVVAEWVDFGVAGASALAGAKMVDGDFQSGTFNNMILNGNNMSGANLTDAAMNTAQLMNANLTNAIMLNTQLAMANLTGYTPTGLHNAAQCAATVGQNGSQMPTPCYP